MYTLGKYKLIIVSLILYPLISFSFSPPKFSLGAGISTLGLNLESNASLHDYWSATFGGHLFKYTLASRSISQTQIKPSLHLESLYLLANFHPFAGNFRISAGAFYNNNHVTAKGVANSGFYTINGQQVPVNQVGALEGRLIFNNFSPYVGFGWGYEHLKTGLGIAADLGVLFQLNPRVTLRGTQITNNNVRQLIQNEKQEFERLARSKFFLKYWPVVALKVYYKFA